MHLFACSARRLAESLTSRRRPSHRSALRHLIPLAGAAGLLILVSACASGSPHQANATGAQPQHTTKAAAAASRHAPATAASQPAPTASPTTGSPGTTGSTGTATSTPPAYTGPDFTTPQAAMAYLAAAYNSDDTTAMHAVTTPQAFTALLAMHPSDVNLQLGSCTARAQGDYICNFRYTYAYTTASGQDSQTRSAMAIVAPALNPGWYMDKFIFGCD
jgi:hypothetical protein